MWTKQLTVDGRVFYYNSTHNKSQWHQPSPVEVLHEAPHLSIPHSPSDSHLQHQNDEILSSISTSQCNEQTSSSYADSHQVDRAHQVQAFGIASSHMLKDETLSSGSVADEIRNPALMRNAEISQYSEPALRYCNCASMIALHYMEIIDTNTLVYSKLSTVLFKRITMLKP